MVLAEIKEVSTLQKMVADLWGLLDNIDTLDDICKGDDASFREKARLMQQRRHKVLTSDGYILMTPDHEQGGAISTDIGIRPDA